MNAQQCTLPAILWLTTTHPWQVCPRWYRYWRQHQRSVLSFGTGFQRTHTYRRSARLVPSVPKPKDKVLVLRAFRVGNPVVKKRSQIPAEICGTRKN